MERSEKAHPKYSCNWLQAAADADHAFSRALNQFLSPPPTSTNKPLQRHFLTHNYNITTIRCMGRGRCSELSFTLQHQVFLEKIVCNLEMAYLDLGIRMFVRYFRL
jgi:hypothetical protein